MTVATYAIIRQGKHQREDARQQHRDRFKPICILMPYNGVDPWNKRCREDRSIPGQSFLRHSGDQVRSQKCRDRSGIEAADQIPISGYEGLDYRTMGTLATCAGESRGGENTPLLVPVRIDDQFTGFSFASMDFYTVTGKLWEIWLEYEDVFGRRFFAPCITRNPCRRRIKSLSRDRRTDWDYRPCIIPHRSHGSPSPRTRNLEPCGAASPSAMSRKRRSRGLKLGYARNAASACTRQTGRFAARPVAGAGGIIRCLF
jgi:hypothetical protein